MTKPTIRELLHTTALHADEMIWWRKFCKDDHLVTLDHKDEMEAAERVLAAATLAERVERVIALHKESDSTFAGRPWCSTCKDAQGNHADWPCRTVRLLEGEK